MLVFFPGQAYLQLRHAADELIGHLHIRAAGVVEGDQLGGQVLVAIEEPSVGREMPGRAGRWEGGTCLSSLTLAALKDAGSPRAINPGPSLQAHRATHRYLYLPGNKDKVQRALELGETRLGVSK